MQGRCKAGTDVCVHWKRRRLGAGSKPWIDGQWNSLDTRAVEPCSMVPLPVYPGLAPSTKPAAFPVHSMELCRWV